MEQGERLLADRWGHQRLHTINQPCDYLGLRRHFRIRFDIRGAHGGYKFDRSGAALHGWRRGRKPRLYHRQYRVYRI